MDQCLCQLRPAYAAALLEYGKCYEQKTRILRDRVDKPSLLELLDEYNFRLCELSATLISYRARLLKALLPHAAEIHREGGSYAREQGVARLLCCGNYADDYCEGAGEIARKFSDREELIAALKEEIRQGDCVLVKASRGAHFEEISEALKVL